MELTSNRLAAVPKRNSAAVISDYVHSQKAFQKHYAAEGLAVMQALDAPHASAQQIASRQKGRVSRPQDDFLLGTPLLKPRVAAAKAIDSAKQKAKFDKENEDGIRDSRLRMPPASKEDNVQASTKKVQDKRKAKIQQELKKPKSKSKNKGNQALEHAHDDENAEHAQRLEDRRDRKRAKKTIMQPPQANDDEKENSDCDKTKGEKQNRRRKDEGRRGQSKGHASLAFMHGFPSTNIGKHRITVEPLLRTVGVFKKGRASFASQTLDKAKKQGNIYLFSESQFLKKAGTKPPKRKREPSPSSSSSNASDDCATKPRERESSPVTPTKAQPAKLGKAETSSSVSKCNDTHHKVTHKPYDPADSIVWDIERESYVEDHESTGGQGTVVVSLPQFRSDACKKSKTDDLADSPLANQSVSILELDPPSEMDCLADAHAASILSLRPSESASRVVSKTTCLPVPTGEAHSVLMVSKFFPGGTATRDKPLIASPKATARASLLMQPLKSTIESPPFCNNQCTPRPAGASPKHFSVFHDNESSLEYPDSFLWPAASFGEPWDVDKEIVAQEYVSDGVGSAYPESFLWPAESFSVNQQEYENNIVDVDPMTHERVLDAIDYDQTSDCGYHEPNFMVMDGFGEDLEGLEGFDMHRYLKNPNKEQLEFQEPFRSGADDIYETEGVYGLMDAQILSGESECSQYLNEVMHTDDMVDDDDDSGLAGHVDRFAQGRELLYGFKLPDAATRSFQEVPSVEAEVADLLRQSHWTPQRL